MLDAHIHLEQGPYTYEWLMEFVEKALEKGMKTIYLLEHSHRFKEFRTLYVDITKIEKYRDVQLSWLNRRSDISIKDYKDFILEMRKKEFPIEIKFGLEICYFPNKKDFISDIVESFNWDFTTGAVHWIDGWGFDHPKTKDTWYDKDVNDIYNRYYDLVIDMVESNLFDIVAHPDLIKCFSFYPSVNMSEKYHKLAKSLLETNTLAEMNIGLHNKLNHPDVGLGEELLKVLCQNGIKFVTASDAHNPKDVGKNVSLAKDRLEACYKAHQG